MFREYLRNLRLFNRNARLFLLGTFIGALGLGMVWVLRNLYLRKIGIDDSKIGNVLSLNSLGLLAVTVPAAVLMDRFRLKGFLLAAGFLGTLGVLGQMLTRDFHAILFWSFMSGVGASLGAVAGAPFVMRNTGPSERVYLFGLLAVVATAGSALSMLIAGVFTRVYGDTAEVQRWVMIGGCAVASLAAIPVFLIREAPVDRKPQEYPLPWFWMGDKDWSTIGRLCLPDFLIGCGAGLTIPFINMYYETRFGIPSDRISRYYAASQIVNMLGFAASPVIARRLGLVKSVVASQLFSIPFFAILAVTTDLRLAVGAFLLRNMLMNMAQPVGSNFAMEVVPEDQRAITNCFKNVSWNAAWVVTASLGGAMAHHFKEIWAGLPWRDQDPNRFGVRDGFSLSMFVTISFYLVAAALFYMFFRGRQGAQPAKAPILAPVPAIAGGPDAE